ncbi:MAG TPA: SLBB domain-containing protein, partial [bacterium]|nr:SLBB domain-containing protein [bacterium]
MIKRIKIGAGSCGIAAGAGEILDIFKKSFSPYEVVEVGCIGHCYAEPLVEVETDSGSVFYGNVKADEKSINNILALGVEGRFIPAQSRTSKELLKVTALAGRIDPVSIEEYELNGGYLALKKALSMESSAVVEDVKKSGLRGRGGAGFPTGLKWSFLAAKQSDRKFLICNADEGDPGAFMDRSMMESVPHQVLEGMLIGVHATGASEIFIYCRAEYPLALKNLKIAASQIEKKGYDMINGRKINIMIKEGAGAFVCGEETAMINSLEGKRGTPRFRPPFPTDSGYKGYPSLINNVETFANIPVLINEGGESYALIGTQGSKGTKLFALAGDIKNPGLVEVPMGITIGEIVYDLGGAERGSVKAVQIGGPSGGCIPEDKFDIS